MKQREIEFRGKRLDNGKWAYGNLVLSSNNARILGDWKKEKGHRVYEIDPETVGQYTGKKDKNKVKIYNGDIISYSSERIGTKRGAKEIAFIDYCPENLEYKLYLNLEKTIYSGVINLFKYDENGGEVVGNIYDNKELIK